LIIIIIIITAKRISSCRRISDAAVVKIAETAVNGQFVDVSVEATSTVEEVIHTFAKSIVTSKERT
jgi:hypothetical protein